MRRVRDLLRFCGVGAAVTLFAVQAAAMSPVPFFRQVERVGLLCVVDAGPATPAGAVPDPGRLCDLAARELVALLGHAGPPVVTLSRNDERIADPATLVVLLHAHARADTASGAIIAFAVTLHRSRADLGSAPFFIAPPEAVAVPPGISTLPEDAIRDGVSRLLNGAVARPLLANREAGRREGR